jgi:hypothetical protein
MVEFPVAVIFRDLNSFTLQAKGRSCPKSGALLRAPCSYPPTVLRFGSKYTFHLLEHCSFVRPGTSAAIAYQSLRTCIRTASLNLASSSVVHLCACRGVQLARGSKAPYHLLRHWVGVRPDTRRAISSQFLPLCIWTAFFNSASSSDVHLPLRALVQPMLGSKKLSHLL